MRVLDLGTAIVNLRRLFLWIMIFFCLLETFIFPSWDNILGALVSVFSYILYGKYIFRLDVIRKRPISFISFSSLILFMYLPLPVTLLDGNEMSHDLYNPKTTYLLQLFYFVCCIGAFNMAGRYSRKHNGLSVLFKKIGLFSTPTSLQLWTLGFIGWVFKFMIMSAQFTGDNNYQAGVGTLSVFAIFIYAPLLLLFYPLIGGNPINKSQKFLLIIYLLLLMIILVATNSRNQVITPLLLFGICYFIATMYRKKTVLSTKKIISVILLFFLIMGPLSDIAFAMLIARSQRQNAKFTELLETTIEIFNNKEQLNYLKAIADKENDKSNYTHSIEWDENYVSNIFLNRVCNYRVVDASIYHAQRAGIPNQNMTDDFLTRLMIMFPQPIVDLFFGHIDKSKFTYSPQDKLYAISYSGTLYAGYRVGGDVGLALSTFGILAFPIIFFVYTLEFILFDNLTWKRHNKILFSFLILINIYLTFFLRFQVGGGIYGHITFITWNFPITILYLSTVYYIVRHIIKR